jgi:hypothetical protein
VSTTRATRAWKVQSDQTRSRSAAAVMSSVKALHARKAPALQPSTRCSATDSRCRPFRCRTKLRCKSASKDLGFDDKLYVQASVERGTVAGRQLRQRFDRRLRNMLDSHALMQLSRKPRKELQSFCNCKMGRAWCCPFTLVRPETAHFASAHEGLRSLLPTAVHAVPVL